MPERLELSALHDALSADLKRRFARRGVPPQDQDDLVQEVFLRAHRARDELRDGERRDAWLARIAQRGRGRNLTVAAASLRSATKGPDRSIGWGPSAFRIVASRDDSPAYGPGTCSSTGAAGHVAPCRASTARIPRRRRRPYRSAASRRAGCPRRSTHSHRATRKSCASLISSRSPTRRSRLASASRSPP
ncbi:MAG: hypothetical protein IT457_14235 [Planctomycetes bacterium]|nr:hypothetical protein [Planctomycetota bacterium]